MESFCCHGNEPVRCRVWLSLIASIGLYSFLLLMARWAVTTDVMLKVQVPPVTVPAQDSQCRMPVARLFSLALPQKEQVYLECWLIQFSSPFSRERHCTGSHIYDHPVLITALSHMCMKTLSNQKLGQGVAQCCSPLACMGSLVEERMRDQSSPV